MCQVRASDLSTHPSPWSVIVARPCCFLGPARFSRVGCWRHFHVFLDSGRLFKNFFKHLNIFLYSFVCVCMHTRACMQHVWRSEDNFRYSALSYHHLGSGEQSQIFRLGSQHLYLLGHLTSPMGRLFKRHLGTPENISFIWIWIGPEQWVVFQVWETKFTVKWRGQGDKGRLNYHWVLVLSHQAVQKVCTKCHALVVWNPELMAVGKMF